jgi:hypothetical protein
MKKCFKPTYLYIKQHKLTGVKYFGKTTRSEKFLLEKYLGSGKKWIDHINKNGTQFVDTIWYRLFETKDELVEFACMFSQHFDITNSNEWANLKLENGLDGGSNGRSGWIPSDSTRNLWKIQRVGKKVSEDTKIKWKKNNRGIKENNFFYKKTGQLHPLHGYKHSTEERLKRSQRMKERMNDFDNRQQIGDRFARNFKIIYPNGDELLVKNLMRWCRTNNIKYSTVRNQRKGWKCQVL